MNPDGKLKPTISPALSDAETEEGLSAPIEFGVLSAPLSSSDTGTKKRE